MRPAARASLPNTSKSFEHGHLAAAARSVGAAEPLTPSDHQERENALFLLQKEKLPVAQQTESGPSLLQKAKQPGPRAPLHQ